VKEIYSQFHKATVQQLKARRIKAGLRQSDVAARMHLPVTAITRLEAGQRRVLTVEFIQMAEIIGFDAVAVLRRLIKDNRHHLR
jgi:transcriptional regulator with XRE-family HTH domain